MPLLCCKAIYLSPLHCWLIWLPFLSISALNIEILTTTFALLNQETFMLTFFLVVHHIPISAFWSHPNATFVLSTYLPIVFTLLTKLTATFSLSTRLTDTCKFVNNMITTFKLVIHQAATFMLLTHLAANDALVSHLIGKPPDFSWLTQETGIFDQFRYLIATYTLLSHLSFICAILIYQITTSAFWSHPNATFALLHCYVFKPSACKFFTFKNTWLQHFVLLIHQIALFCIWKSSLTPFQISLTCLKTCFIRIHAWKLSLVPLNNFWSICLL